MRYDELYEHLNFNLDYRITHKNLHKALIVLQKQLNENPTNIKSIYDYLDLFDGEDLIDIFMQLHI